MSSLYELPSTPEEVREHRARSWATWHAAHAATTVPLQLCGDISHGVADADGTGRARQLEPLRDADPVDAGVSLQEHGRHLQLDVRLRPGGAGSRASSTLHRLKGLIDANAGRFPCGEVTGYLEIGGPKLGREYSDRHLERMLVESLQALKAVFTEGERTS